MKNILEEEWSHDDVIVLYADDERKDAREKLAHAAPNMARALKRIIHAFPRAYASEEEYQATLEARAALAKAGAPLP